MTQGKTTPRIIAAREHERQVLELRKTGASFADIAQALGYKDRTGAYKACRRAMDRSATEMAAEAEELRQLESLRMDEALMALWPRIVAGDVEAIGVMLRMIAVRARLFGLNLSPDLSVPAGAIKAYIGIDVDLV